MCKLYKPSSTYEVGSPTMHCHGQMLNSSKGFFIVILMINFQAHVELFIHCIQATKYTLLPPVYGKQHLAYEIYSNK